MGGGCCCFVVVFVFLGDLVSGKIQRCLVIPVFQMRLHQRKQRTNLSSSLLCEKNPVGEPWRFAGLDSSDLSLIYAYIDILGISLVTKSCL